MIYVITRNDKTPVCATTNLDAAFERAQRMGGDFRVSQMPELSDLQNDICFQAKYQGYEKDGRWFFELIAVYALPVELAAGESYNSGHTNILMNFYAPDLETAVKMAHEDIMKEIRR